MLKFGASRRANWANLRCTRTDGGETLMTRSEFRGEPPLTCGLAYSRFTLSSTGPVTGAPGPADGRWRKQKFGSPLPTSPESCWATTTRPRELSGLCRRVPPVAGMTERGYVRHTPRVFEGVKSRKLIPRFHSAALRSLVDGSFAGCRPTNASGWRVSIRTKTGSLVLHQENKSA